MLTVSAGSGVDYYLGEVSTAREYYTGAVAAGEPPGVWFGAGAEALGLRGEVDPEVMRRVYDLYLDPRDPLSNDPSRWHEAATLGHTGRRYSTEEELYAAVLDAEPDASPERRAEIKLDAGRRARRNVSFLDVTFNVQKSVTVLHTALEAQEVKARAAGDADAAEAWGARRRAVEDAIWAGNRAGLDHLAEHAGYARIGHHGGAAGRWVDSHDWTVASFFQHDSRDHDPHLHIHNTVLNRVEGPDGQFRTLDSKAIHRARAAASAVADRTTEEQVATALGVPFATRSDGKARELVGVPQEALDLFSSRRRAITAKTAQLVAAFEAQFGRAPNGLQLDRLARQATMATRTGKAATGETTPERLERWDGELRAEVDGGLEAVARAVLAQTGHDLTPEPWSPQAVIETALADVQASKSAWTASDLTRAINAALPDRLGDLDGTSVAELLDGLTAQALELAKPLDALRPGDAALPDELRLRSGESAYQAPGARRYATPEHLHTERALLAATAAGGAAALPSAAARRFVEQLAAAGIELGADQAAAVTGVLTSGARVESLVGPAGTGKSFVVGALAKAWTDPSLRSARPSGGDDPDSAGDPAPGRVFGLATSQVATDVLTGEGLTARNVARWLATQARVNDAAAAGRAPVAEDAEWALRAGDLVVVDESAMADTAALAAIHARVDAAGAKLLLVGDHRQLAAIGAGGAMDLLATAGTAGTAYELAEARRFAEPWERDATLRLRAGDRTVLDTYHRQGRLLDGGAVEHAEASAARAWLGDTLAGRRSLLLVDTNEQAVRLSAQLRADLVRLGRVAESGVPLGLQGTFAGVGDLVQARRNGWHLAGHDGNRRGPINRETYRVVDARPDGSLVVTTDLTAGASSAREPGAPGLGERIVLPAEYVVEHVALGYATTVHAAQGATMDTAHIVVTAGTGPEALYVGMSRGRAANTAHVTTLAVPADAQPGQVHDAVHRSPAAVLDAALDAVEGPQQSALAAATESAADAESVRTAAELLADAAELATAGRTATWLDALVDAGTLTSEQRAQIAAEDGGPTLSRVLRRAELAGHDPHAVLVAAVTERPLDGARQLANVLHHRITAAWPLDPAGDSYRAWVPRVDDPQYAAYLAVLANAADNRRDELGEQLAAEPPQWTVEALGAPPEDVDARAEWVDRAGTVAAHRELVRHNDAGDALGPAPKPGQAEAYASWRAAWRALGRPEADRDEAELSDGQLLVRIRAARREAAWGPRYVANELAGTRQAAAAAERTAELRAAEAATADPDQLPGLERAAADAAALASTLHKRAAELQQVDDARAAWLAHTAATRAAADRAIVEYEARRAADGRVDQPVTADEWLDEYRRHLADEDPHRDVTDEADFAVDEPHAHVPVEEWAAAHAAAVDEDDQHRDVTDEADLADVAEQRRADLDQLRHFDHGVTSDRLDDSVDESAMAVEEPADTDQEVQTVDVDPAARQDGVDVDRHEAVRDDIVPPLWGLTEDAAAADDADRELTDFDADPVGAAAPPTAAEWADLDAAATAENDAVREVVDEAELVDVAEQREADRAAVDARTYTVAGEPVDDDAVDHADAPPPDLRDVAADESDRVDEDQVRVPAPEETAEALRAGHRALAEIAQREAVDAERAAEEARAAELAQWAAEQQPDTTAQRERVAEPGVLDRADAW